MRKYLESSNYIDWKSESVFEFASLLSSECSSREQIVESCFKYVRDQIEHSLDFKRNPVTCKASDVLKEKTGFCFAKSHLLAALLRANGIPCALVYQRIALGEERNVFYWHGLNAVFLEGHGWYKLDPRGLKSGLESNFTPPIESLPFSSLKSGEYIHREYWAEPSDQIISLLESSQSYLEVIERLPSIKLI